MKKYKDEPYLRAHTPEHATMHRYLREQDRTDISEKWDKMFYKGNLREYVYEKHPEIWAAYKTWRRVIHGL